MCKRQVDRTIRYTLNPDTPMIKVPQQGISPGVVFGIDTALFSLSTQSTDQSRWNELIDTKHHENEVDLVLVKSNISISRSEFELLLNGLDKEYFYRVKGFVMFDATKCVIVNWAFGRVEWTEIEQPVEYTVRLTIMGANLKRFLGPFQTMFEQVEYIAAHRH